MASVKQNFLFTVLSKSYYTYEHALRWKTRQHMKEDRCHIARFKAVFTRLNQTTLSLNIESASSLTVAASAASFCSFYKFPRHEQDEAVAKFVRSNCDLTTSTVALIVVATLARHGRSHTDPNKRSAIFAAVCCASTFPHPAEAPFWFPSPRVTRLSTGCGKTPSRRR